eukprot:2550-Heterococcus_DN1.PRE.3
MQAAESRQVLYLLPLLYALLRTKQIGTWRMLTVKNNKERCAPVRSFSLVPSYMHRTSFHFFAVHLVAVVVAAAAHTAGSAVSTTTLAIIARNLLRRLHNGRTTVAHRLGSTVSILLVNTGYSREQDHAHTPVCHMQIV